MVRPSARALKGRLKTSGKNVNIQRSTAVDSVDSKTGTRVSEHIIDSVILPIYQPVYKLLLLHTFVQHYISAGNIVVCVEMR